MAVLLRQLLCMVAERVKFGIFFSEEGHSEAARLPELQNKIPLASVSVAGELKQALEANTKTLGRRIKVEGMVGQEPIRNRELK